MNLIANTDDTLLNLLAVMSPESSKTTLRSWIGEKRITIDGVLAKQGQVKVNKGQLITLNPKTRLIGGGIKIVYEDSHLVAIEKPSGLLSVATAFEKGETAHNILKQHYHPRKVQVVHRIDQDTSGVMLYALSDAGYKGLKILFEAHSIDRTYCAIIEGHISPPQGTWESYLYEDERYIVHSTTNQEQGRLAITHYLTKKTSPLYSLMELKLETGRKNQIRVHCTDHGCPIAGDKKYGAKRDPIKRLCLHAASIGFVHPVTGKAMFFESPIPEKFNTLCR